MSRMILWTAAAALSLLMGGLSANESPEAVREEEEAHSSRDFAAQKVCEGQPYTWADDKTLVCHRERP